MRVRFTANVVPPGITQHPQSQTVAIGQVVTFTVAASGATPLSYQWQRNDVNIPGATSDTYTITARRRRQRRAVPRRRHQRLRQRDRATRPRSP